jgi:hypothetical protein
VLPVIWEFLLQIAIELLFELGFESTGESLRRRRRAHPVLAFLGATLLGGAVGLVTSLIWPTRFFEPGPLPGVSVIISPLVTGLAMHHYGRWRNGKGSFLATFWGGALFAFGMASVRFIWVAM